jgi:hypothetical protein
MKGQRLDNRVGEDVADLKSITFVVETGGYLDGFNRIATQIKKIIVHTNRVPAKG